LVRIKGIQLNNELYNGPKLKIGKDAVVIKARNIKLGFSEIESVCIKNTRISRASIFLVMAGILALAVILYLLIVFIQGMMGEMAAFSGGGLYYRKHLISVIMFFFIGAPIIIILKIKKYLRKEMMLVIRWKNDDFRIKVSEMRRTVYEINNFFESKGIKVSSVNS